MPEEEVKKKKQLPSALAFLVFVFALLLLAFAIIGVIHAVKPVSVPNVEKSSLTHLSATVLIDAGHGGTDTGATGVSGVHEDVLNLDVAKKLQKLLADFGCKVIMTRETDDAIAPTKAADMQKRADIIKSSNADIVLSIHMNYHTDASSSGPQVFYYETSEQGRVLSKDIQTQMNAILQPSSPRINMKANYLVLRAGNAPAVTVECGFVSNAKEEAQLKQESYREKVAESIFEGIKDYFSEHKEDSKTTMGQ